MSSEEDVILSSLFFVENEKFIGPSNQKLLGLNCSTTSTIGNDRSC